MKQRDQNQKNHLCLQAHNRGKLKQFIEVDVIDRYNRYDGGYITRMDILNTYYVPTPHTVCPVGLHMFYMY